MQLRRGLLRHSQPLLVIRDRPVGVDARLHADLAGAELHRVPHAPAELVLGVLVGIRRAPSLAKAAERAAHGADVGDVDVAVDHEGHGVPGQPRAQLVRRLAHVLVRRGPGFPEQGGELLLGQRQAVTSAGHGARYELGANRPVVPAARPAPWDKAPELRLDHVEHALLEPVGVHVLGVDAQPLGERVAARGQLLAHAVHGREGVLGRDVVAVGR